jgi:hypothetical protein
MTFWALRVIDARLFVAYATSAKDNCKGVPTLFCSGGGYGICGG